LTKIKPPEEGSSRRIFERTTKDRPRIRLTIRQRMRVLDEWPRHETLL
jgi:hypothetical protein